MKMGQDLNTKEYFTILLICGIEVRVEWWLPGAGAVVGGQVRRRCTKGTKFQLD
jgi:hypothetical protein